MTTTAWNIIGAVGSGLLLFHMGALYPSPFIKRPRASWAVTIAAVGGFTFCLSRLMGARM